MESPVSVYSEFQPLEEMIVGTPYPSDSFDKLEDQETKDMLKRIMIETEEDCARLASLLQEHGVKVRRPKVMFDLMKYNDRGQGKMTYIDLLRFGYCYPNPPLWPRDMTLTLGNKILSVYSRTPGRWLEGWSFYDLMREYFEGGADWVSMPPPILEEEAQNYRHYENKALMFHAACFVRCGRDVFHTRPAFEDERAKGTRAGLDWVKRQFGDEFRFHQVDQIGHLDGKIAFVKPGVLMSWLQPEKLPESLQKWDVIQLHSKGEIPEEFNRLRGKRFYKDFIKKWLEDWIGSVEETYFDVNVISINEELMITNGDNPELRAELKKRGVETIPFDFRHRYFWDGGLHCITLDVRRKGACEDYLS